MIRINIFKGNEFELRTGKDTILVLMPHGYLLTHSDKFYECDVDNVFDILNWQSWTEKKPDLLISDISNCGSGIILNPDGTNDYYLALSCGWKKFESFKALYDWYNINWNDQKEMLISRQKSVTVFTVMKRSMEVGQSYTRIDKPIDTYLSLYGMIKNNIDVNKVKIVELIIFKYEVDESIPDLIKVYNFKINRVLSDVEIREKIEFMNNMERNIINLNN